MMKSFVVGATYLSEYDSIESKDNCLLIRIVRMSTLCEGPTTHVVGYQNCLWGIRLPLHRRHYEVEWLNSLSHSETVATRCNGSMRACQPKPRGRRHVELTSLIVPESDVFTRRLGVHGRGGSGDWARLLVGSIRLESG